MTKISSLKINNDELNDVKEITLSTEGIQAEGFGRSVLRLSSEKNCIKKMIPMTLEEFNSLKEVIEKLKKLDHEFLIPVSDYYYTEQSGISYLVLEKPYNDKSYPLSLANTDKELNPEQLLNYLMQVFAALSYLHQNEIIHFSLKPENIIIQEGKAYITDYWIASLIGPTTIISKAVGMKNASKFIPPEMWKGFIQNILSNEIFKHLYNVDTYSALLSFYEVLTKNDIKSISKKMAFEKIVEYDKLFSKSGISWFDQLVVKNITPTYKGRESSKKITLFLEDVQKNEEKSNVGFEDNNYMKKYINTENYTSIEVNGEKKQAKEFEIISKKFNFYKSLAKEDRSAIVIIGNKLSKNHPNVKTIDFDKDASSSLKDAPMIEAFVETFANEKIILLNVDDYNAAPQIMKVFDYLGKLATRNKSSRFIIFSDLDLSGDKKFVQHIEEKLDICKDAGNMIYISTVTNQGIGDKELDDISTPLPHEIKLSIGALDIDGKIQTSSNRLNRVNYYAYGDSTLKASLHVVLLTKLLWSYHPDWHATQLLNELRHHTIGIRSGVLDFFYTTLLIEAKFFVEGVVLNTPLIENAKSNRSIDIIGLNVSFDLHLNKYFNELLFKNPMDIFPLSIRLKFNMGNDIYDFKIMNDENNNIYQREVELRKVINGKKEVLFTAPFQYDLNKEEVAFSFHFKKKEVVINIGTNDEIYFEHPFLLSEIKEIELQKTDKNTHFKNLFVAYHSTKCNNFDLLIQYEDEDQLRHFLGQCFKHIDTGNAKQLADFLNKSRYKQGLANMFFSHNARNNLDPIEALNLFTQILDDKKRIQLFSKEQRNEKKEQISGLIKSVSESNIFIFK